MAGQPDIDFQDNIIDTSNQANGLPDNTPPNYGQGSAALFGNVSNLTGSWYNTARSGEGIVLDHFAVDHILVYWYTFDDEGRPLWLVGDGAIHDNLAIVSLVRVDGARFGAAFDPSDVRRANWGSITLKADSCDVIRATYRRLDGTAGELPMTRLTAGHECTVVPAQPKLTLERCTSDWFTGSQCTPAVLPYVSQSSQSMTVLGGPPRLELASFRLSSAETLTVRNVNVSDSRMVASPAFRGVQNGTIVQPGAPLAFSLESGFTAGVITTLRFRFDIEGQGTQFDATVTLVTN